MRTLTLRIYLTVVATLLLFTLASGWLVQRHFSQERDRHQSVFYERTAAWADLIQRSLPAADTPVGEQAAAVRDWSARLGVPLALHDATGLRLAASDSFLRREASRGRGGFAMALEDGRTLWMMRPGPRARDAAGAHSQGERRTRGPFSFFPPGWTGGVGLVVLLGLLFLAVAGAAWPVARALTQRLQALQRGVERFGAGQLAHRVEVTGRDEVAALAASFNGAAGRIEALVRSHQSLLANASHELRSPLARMKMAVTMLDHAGSAERQRLMQEISTNVAELDGLVEEVLLASRLDATASAGRLEPVDLLGLAVEEAARMGAVVEGEALTVSGDERLLRRALRNLLENARRYGGSEVAVRLSRQAQGVSLTVCDRGAGVPADQRERIFEPFYRLPGHAENAGGVGLGLSLVKQIAAHHHGSVRCEPREGGGSCFRLVLPG